MPKTLQFLFSIANSDSSETVTLVPHVVYKKKFENAVKVERPHHTTYDIKLESGFEVKLTKEPLVEKIKREEMI